MLIQGDANALEMRCAAFLSQDQVMMEEIRNNVDMHTMNQERLGLPSRLIAKTFVFRLIYGGSAYSYANDPNFSVCKFSEKKWQEIIEKYYDKYKGLHKWHIKILQEVTLTGKLSTPTGRQFLFEPELRRGERVFPQTTIKNYPVQSLGADLMTIARVSLYNRMRKLNYEKARLVNTVHDSIIIDCDSSHVDTLAKMMLDVFEDVPKNFKKMFNTEFNLPMKAEIETGQTWGEMKPWGK